MTQFFTTPIKVFVVAFLLLQLFVVPCLAEVSIPAGVSMQKNMGDDVEGVAEKAEIDEKTKLLWEWKLQKEKLSIDVPDGFESDRILKRQKFNDISIATGLIVLLGIFTTTKDVGVCVTALLISPIMPVIGVAADYLINSNDYYNKNCGWVDLNSAEIISRDKNRIKYSGEYLLKPNYRMGNENAIEELNVRYGSQGVLSQLEKRDPQVVCFANNEPVYPDYKNRNTYGEIIKGEYRRVIDIVEYDGKTWCKIKIKDEPIYKYKELKIIEGWVGENAIDVSNAKVGDVLYPKRTTAMYDYNQINIGFSNSVTLSENDILLIVEKKHVKDYDKVELLPKGLWCKVRVVK